ncbi:aminotransferase class I/II-fold pyridoxal phosphate-dependent enzyme [Pseudomonas sp. Z4-20]|uniref:aminotransferase class I/II-fold pyridoxal phosphate-dependent enzyme n=1 Tax=Pseudomonas sp. Z4-20 TaxID=2817414 RepID=UPI003DA7D997
MNQTSQPTHHFSNYRKIVSLADQDWQSAETEKVARLNVEVKTPNVLVDQYGRTLQHFCTTSYLGLDYHPALLDGAMTMLWETGTLRIANSRNRCRLAILDQYETQLSELFGASCLSALSCSAASAGILPLLASGALTGNRPPVMVFDKQAHYSMNHIKAACADETQVLTCPHNDMDFLEDVCKRQGNVAYVADGAYSMGGMADLDSLLYLKQRYDLFLYVDDSHALSTVGKSGIGLMRSRVHTVDERTLIVASLAKSFGAGGGLAMFGDERHKTLAQRYGGPSNWSQCLNSAAIGAGMASIRLHRSREFQTLQERLQANIRFFDSLIRTEQYASPMAIRLVHCGEATAATRLAVELADLGYFTSAVFFPVVPQDKAAIRITLRADMETEVIRTFCERIIDLLLAHGRDIRP